MPAFQDVQESHQIGIHVGLGFFQRVSHPGLRRHMEYRRGRRSMEQRGNRVAICDVHPLELEPGNSLEFEASLLQSDVIIVVEIVDAPSPGLLRQERHGQVIPDKAGSTGHQNAFYPLGHSWEAGSPREH